MVIGLCRVSLSIPGSRTLKEKRRVLESLKVRLRKTFNISLAEVGRQEEWSRCDLAIVCVSSSRRYADGLLAKVINYLDEEGESTLLEYQTELL
ncbi:MAG: DUF503 domain-containing protein [Firmicutes bacterium]|nr:DUF503 domain-containing protein [Bacillota bacterium]